MSDDATELMKWYGWANVHTTDEVAAMLHKQAAEIARLRSVCREQAEKLSAATVHMMPGGRARSHALGVIADLENAGKEPSDGL